MEAEVQLYPLLNLGARCGWVVTATPRPLYPWERDPVRIVSEAGWALEPVWAGAENVATTGIRSPDHEARSESLYLRAPARLTPKCSTFAHSVNSCVLYESHNKQRLFLFAKLRKWLFKTERESVYRAVRTHSLNLIQINSCRLQIFNVYFNHLRTLCKIITNAVFVCWDRGYRRSMFSQLE